jgi:alkanesulfonate monooxygenase SsuD/methylene tetrahydromethanopterin reductase-like flavin-dependent oxidoreductase (luciferase family)
MGRPLEIVREYVAVLRQALNGRVEHAGPRYRVAWQSGVPRLPAPPPIYLAGLGPAMLELAGEIADGAVLWLCAPAYIREHAVPAIRRGRERAGKALDGFEIVASVPAAVTADRVAAAAAFKSELGRYLALPFYRAMLVKSGFAAEIAAWSAAPGPAAVDDRLAGGLGAVGAAETLRAFMAAYRAAGVTLPAIRPIGFPDAPHYLPTLEAGAAF